MSKKKTANQRTFTEKMADLASDLGLYHDGTDNRYLDHQESLTVFVNLMTKDEYTALEEDLADFEIKGKGFKVRAWNDSSSYDYWKRQGENGDSNYIMITAYVDRAKINLINTDEMREALTKARIHFCIYDNADKFYREAKLRELKSKNIPIVLD